MAVEKVIMDGVTVRWKRKLDATPPGERKLITEIGVLAGVMLRTRLQGRQEDADGKPLPPLRPQIRRLKNGAPSKPYPKYARYKQRQGAKPVRDFTLTGTLWRSLTMTVPRMGAEPQIKLYFGGKDRKQKILNREKARLAMFPTRGMNGEVRGQQAFYLMKLSKGEMKSLTDTYTRGLIGMLFR